MEVARNARTTLRLAGLGLLAAIVLVLGWRSLQGALHLAAGVCPNPGGGTFPGLAIVVIGLGAFGAGHLTARYRAVRIAPGHPPRDRASDVAVHVLLALFFLAILLVLAYETAALLWIPGLWPITTFVRCAEAIDPATTTASTAAFCLLAGHWFWYPEPAPRRRR